MTGRRLLREQAKLERQITRLKAKLTAALDADDEDVVARTHTELEDTELAMRVLTDRRSA